MKALAVLFLLVSIAPASSATLTVTMDTTNATTCPVTLPAGVFCATKTLSPAHLGLLQDAFTRLLQGPGGPAPTAKAIFNAMVNRWFSDVVDFVRAQRREAVTESVEDIQLQ